MASPARKGTSGGGERISVAVLRNSDSVMGIRFVPLHPPNAPRTFGSASACFTPMSSLLTSFCGRLRPCRLLGDSDESVISQYRKLFRYRLLFLGSACPPLPDWRIPF